MGRPRKQIGLAAAAIDDQANDNSASDLPASILVKSLFAFYGDDGAFHQWQPGTRITDPDEIALLMDRASHAIEV